MFRHRGIRSSDGKLVYLNSKQMKTLIREKLVDEFDLLIGDFRGGERKHHLIKSSKSRCKNKLIENSNRLFSR